MANYKASPYVPSFLRASLQNGRSISLTFSDVSGSNINNENSFGYSVQGTGLRSTQQLNVDWSKFENHTFFMSAESKVNLAFEQIINGFPFDGNREEVENFFSNLTGFDKWVFDRFPKFHGQLHFSGTQTSETSPLKGTYISVKDIPGSLFPDLTSKKTSAQSILNFGMNDSLSIEMNLKIPEIQTNGTQIILQKIDKDRNHGFSIRLNPTTSTTTAIATFDIFSGSSNMSVPISFEKGKFNHLCFVLDRSSNLQNLKLYNQETFVTQSASTQIGYLNINYSDFLIGSGSSYKIGTSTVTPSQTLSGTMDELRVFHSIRSIEQQKSYAKKSIYATPDLKLYFKFNEPPPPLSPIDGDLVNSIVLDSSGNSLHSYISNFTGSLRQNSLEDTNSNLIYEKDSLSPILFPANNDVINLNVELLASASSYDQENPNLITRLIPKHYLIEGASYEGFSSEDENIGSSYGNQGIPGQGQLSNVQVMLSLLYIWAKFFDEIKLYLDAFSSLKTVEYDLNKSVPNNFLFDIVKHYGFFLPPMFTSSNIEQYVSAENIDPLTKGNESLSLQSVQNEILRRILINLPAVIRSKGTQHSIKAFIRSVGIEPDASMRFREYGGPTYKKLQSSREQKTDIAGIVNFSTGSLVISKFLSGSRVEVGYPEPQGNFVNKHLYRPHGISDSLSDGLFTSGSWTFECSYKYNLQSIPLNSVTQSLARLCVTGSGIQNPGLVANLIGYYDVVSPRISLFLRPGNDANSPALNLSLSLPKEAIFGGDIWNISFGCKRNDSMQDAVSSSYFLRAGLQNYGEINYIASTSSYFYELTGSSASPLNSNVFQTIDLTHETNSSGSFICMGSNQAIPVGSTDSYRFLNNSLKVANDEARATTFDGRAMKLRFWSRYLEENEWIEHVRNYQSLGVNDPLKNYNYEKVVTGSFERLRLDSLTKQENKVADSSGKITFIDFSENLIDLSGIGFPNNRNCITPEIIYYTHLSPYFDESITTDKIRVRGYKDEELIKRNQWAQKTPVYEIYRSESPVDDSRFSIDFSLVDALNKDIINVFATFDSLQNYLGNPELMFSADYPDLEKLRNVYFNRLKNKLNFKAFFEFYSWFDNSISTFIEQLIPRKSVFKGSNFLVESHMLERHKHEYRFFTNYFVSSNAKQNNFTTKVGS